MRSICRVMATDLGAKSTVQLEAITVGLLVNFPHRHSIHVVEGTNDYEPSRCCLAVTRKRRSWVAICKSTYITCRAHFWPCQSSSSAAPLTQAAYSAKENVPNTLLECIVVFLSSAGGREGEYQWLGLESIFCWVRHTGYVLHLSSIRRQTDRSTIMRVPACSSLR